MGHTLDVTLSKLYEQVRLELQFVSGQDSLSKTEYDHAKDITQTFASRLPKVRLLLDSDIRAAYEGDPARNSVDEVLVCYPGITAITHYRIAHELFQLGVPLIARMIAELAHSTTGGNAGLPAASRPAAISPRHKCAMRFTRLARESKPQARKLQNQVKQGLVVAWIDIGVGDTGRELNTSPSDRRWRTPSKTTTSKPSLTARLALEPGGYEATFSMPPPNKVIS